MKGERRTKTSISKFNPPTKGQSEKVAATMKNLLVVMLKEEETNTTPNVTMITRMAEVILEKLMAGQ